MQAATYTDVAKAKDHIIVRMLKGSYGGSREFACITSSVRRMMHPNLAKRATIEEVLTADLFST